MVNLLHHVGVKELHWDILSATRPAFAAQSAHDLRIWVPG
ncbi:protein of unknown function [Acidithiobacillus ferrivorans]|uniref:Uncharacterized protein n=1 Tax=Acidithiobacillus ferrivorans TaxID=160808 RepID=A0ABY1MSC9_9PROT|nr:protein of unknown function [Acidithiobacillus ferrivorans]